MKEKEEGRLRKKKPPILPDKYVLTVVVCFIQCAGLEEKARERVELGRAIRSEAMVGSVLERVGGGGSSCSGDRDRTGRGNWGPGKDDWEGCTWSSTVTTRSLRPSLPVRPRERGTAGRFSVGADVIDGSCECVGVL